MSDPTSDRPEQLCLLLVDVQERLCAAMDPSVLEQSVKNMLHLLKLAELYGIPVIATEQYPKGLGSTLPELRAALPEGSEPIEKLHFSCCEAEGFRGRLAATGRKTLVVMGMETHICVVQTVRGLLPEHRVLVPVDAVLSRRKLAWKTGLGLMLGAGAELSTTETILFDVLGRAGTDEFRTISRRLR
jgi:nicotinamidase-related amidase